MEKLKYKNFSNEIYKDVKNIVDKYTQDDILNINSYKNNTSKYKDLLKLKSYYLLKENEDKYNEYVKRHNEEYERRHHMEFINDETNKYLSTIIHDTDNKEDRFEMLKSIVPKKHIRKVFLKYELLYYTADKKFKNDINNIVKYVNKFCPIVQHFLEDTEWNIHTKDTLNFKVPSNKTVLTNTVSKIDATNKKLIKYMDELVDFIKRNFDVKKVRYRIIDDNKYKMSWLFIII